MKIDYTFLLIVVISAILFTSYVNKSNYSNNVLESLSGEYNDISNNSFEDIDFEAIPESLEKFTYQVKTDNNSEYSQNILLPSSKDYNLVEGITTFRGNNYRDSASFGTVELSENKLEKVWTNIIGQTDTWTGVGWNGQPSIIKWNDLTKQHMNLYDEFKQKDDFVEVIYGTLDSNVHFYDLDSGKESRPSIYAGSSIKGSVTVDPRGYPLLYVGQGINEVSGESVRFGYHIFSLIDGKELFFINGRDKFAYSGWGAFDGNPVIDKENDLLILPGENGLIYIVKLNTIYDKVNGTISIAPEVTKYKFAKNGRGTGVENSIAVYKKYAYFINNNGVMQCLNLNTLTPIWSYNMEDDCDATIGLEEENGNIMLYAGCEVDKRYSASPSYAKKIDGRTGKVLWEYSCICQYDANVNGGLLSSPIIGKNEISNIVIYNFSKTTSLRTGKMVALDKSNGNVVWEKDLTYYSWSSPVAVYNESGKAYIIFCDSNGQVHLIDGKTGETLYTLQTGGGNFEGSPAIYNNHIVIGSRGKRIYRIDIK